MQRPGPYSLGLATSILQDAAEAFLRILAVHLRIKVHANQSFSEVLGNVANEIPTVAQHSAALTQLNSARVMFKHQGLSTLQKNDVIVFSGNIATFMDETCRMVFDLDFATVSLADAIGHRRTQNWIAMAEEAFESGDYEVALERAAGAMAICLAHSDAHDPAFKASLSIPSFSELNLRAPPVFDRIDMQGRDYQWRSAIGEFARWAKTRIDNTHDRLRLMSRGVDVGSYDKFIMIAPMATVMVNGSIRFQHRHPRTPASGDDARFCIDLVIDSALALRSNRPPARAPTTAPAAKMRVVDKVEVLVDPDETAPEVIRSAAPGEFLQSVSHHLLSVDGEYVAVLQDGDVAYVTLSCVEEVGPDNCADVEV